MKNYDFATIGVRHGNKEECKDLRLRLLCDNDTRFRLARETFFTLKGLYDKGDRKIALDMVNMALDAIHALDSIKLCQRLIVEEYGEDSFWLPYNSILESYREDIIEIWNFLHPDEPIT